MTLGTLVISIAVVALLLTLFVGMVLGQSKNLVVSFLQNFCGSLFIFSGAVKAVDPLGTAYKMEQYFAELKSVFEGTWFSSLAPLFPWLSEYSAAFSVFMIVFEIVLGIMLIIGASRRFTAWAFLLLVVFFTFLTGFTFLTAYVPDGVNFFQFAKWGPYVETNMKVTDCGCFGDFLKLAPKLSFFKDLVLLVPALVFVVASRQMHRLFAPATRWGIVGISTLALTIYCLSNYVWNLPDIDFRPFKEGVNVRERKDLEREAQENVKIIAYQMTNKETGERVELPFDQYMKEFAKYPSEEWDLEQIKSKPEVERTKISDFEVSNLEGMEVTDEILQYQGYSFMIVAYKLYGASTAAKVMVKDTVFAVDTIRSADSLELRRRVVSVQEQEVSRDTYSWEEKYLKPWIATVNPVMEAAMEAGVKVFAITAYADPGKIDDFRHATQSAYPFYVADDILLKTIIRSNPGVTLLKDGKVIKHWHHRKLPSFDQIQSKYMP